MKKSLFVVIFALFACATLLSQNIQLHYDFGKLLYNDLDNRQNVTVTFDCFKFDKWGSTYLLADLDFDNDGMMGTYVEIEREFCLSRNRQWAAHIEYSGGLTTGHLPEYCYGNRFQHAVLAGGAWNWVNEKGTKNFSVQALYKYVFKGKDGSLRPFSSFHTSMIWGMQLLEGKCTFAGFFDAWYDPNVNGRVIFTTEPQFWFNFNGLEKCKELPLSIGTEVKINNNLIWTESGTNDRFFVIPTLALKWTFD